MIADYLQNNDLDKHIEKIKKLYKSQADAMIKAMEEFFPDNVKFTYPKGGMFTWVTLEEGKDVLALFDKAISNNVAFVPGHPFYVKPENVNTLRLNYTNADEQTIRTGIERLAQALREI